MENFSIKKSIMFIMGEDYNFLTYNIFIILHVLKCYSGNRVLRDHRKLSFLIDFSSNKKLTDIVIDSIQSDKPTINKYDRELLNQSYTNSLIRKKTVNQLIFALVNEGFLDLNSKKLERMNISLVKNKIPKGFVKRDGLFSIEQKNITNLTNLIQRISYIDLDTMLTHLYFKHGVANEQLID